MTFMAFTSNLSTVAKLLKSLVCTIYVLSIHEISDVPTVQRRY
jgi:hypothetical protein